MHPLKEAGGNLRAAPVVRRPVNVDVLGLQGVAYGDRDRIVALPGMQDRIEIDIEQLDALLEQHAGVGVRKVVARFVVVPAVLSQDAVAQRKLDIARQRSVVRRIERCLGAPDLSVRAAGAVILGPERMPNLVLAGPVNLHQLVERDVLDEHDKHQFLVEPLLVSRDGVFCLEELDRFHG